MILSWKLADARRPKNGDRFGEARSFDNDGGFERRKRDEDGDMRQDRPKFGDRKGVGNRAKSGNNGRFGNARRSEDGVKSHNRSRTQNRTTFEKKS
jgi:hypothetical protein